MPLLQAEPRAAVLEIDPEPFGGIARPEPPEDRIDQTDRHPVPVHHRDIDRVPVHRLGQRRRRRHRPFRVDQPGQPLCRFRRQHMRQPRHPVRVRDEAVTRVIGQLRRLGLDMRALCPERIHRRQIEMLQDVQHQDRRRPLPVRRMLQQFHTLVLTADRIAIVAGHAREILQPMRPAQRAQRRDHVLGHLALVEPLAPLLGDAPQNLGLTRRAEDLPRLRHRAIDQIELPRRTLQRRRILGPVKGHARRDGHALVGIADRGGQNGIQPQLAPIRRQPAERIHRTRQRDRLHPMQRHRRQPPVAHGLRRIPRRCPPRPVQRDHLLAPRRFQQDKAIAADPRHLRLADPQKHRPGNRRIHRIPTPFQHLDRRLGGKGMRGRADAVAGIDGRTARQVEIAHLVPPLFRKGN